MNAMAAVGGVDTFIVVVSDEAAGVHVHGPLGLLQFVPILGNFLNPGGGHRVAQTITVNVTPVAGVDLSLPRRLPLGRRTRRIPGRGRPRLTGGSQFRLVQVGARPDQPAAGITNGVPENGPGTYVYYDSDAQLARNGLGMNTFRMSIEWSRIFPNSTAVGGYLG